MGQKQSKRISAQSEKNPKRSEEVEVPVEGRESDPETWSAVLQLSEQRLDEVKLSLEDMMDESEGCGAESQDITEILAALSETINIILQEKREEKAQMEQKVSALEDRTLELEEAAQAFSAEEADHERTRAAMSEASEKRVLERTEIQKAECEVKLSAMAERLQELMQERTEEKVQMEQKVSALEDRTLELEEAAQAFSAKEADPERTRAAMSEAIEKRVLERTEIQKAECEVKLSAMAERLQELMQERTEEKVQMEQKVSALEDRTLELEEAAQAFSAEEADHERTRAAMSEASEKRVLERTEIQKAECEVKLSAMAERLQELMQERTEEKAQMEQKVSALEDRTLELEEAAQAFSAKEADPERTRAAMSEAIEKRVLERTEIQKAECEVKLSAMAERLRELMQERAEEKAQMEQKVSALEDRTLELEEAAQAFSAEEADRERTRAAMSEASEKRVLERTEIQKAECEVKLSAMAERLQELMQERAEEKAQMEQKVSALEDRTLELDEAAQAFSAEKAVCEQKLASMSGMIDKLVLEKAEEKAEYERRLAAMYETIDRRVLEITEIQKAECDLKLAGISQIIAKLVLEKMEMQMEAMTGLNAGVTAEPLDFSTQATAEREAQMDHNMPALEEPYQVPQEKFSSKMQERTHMDIEACAEEKRTTGLVQAAQEISEESTEFRENSVATPDTTDLRLLTTTQEKMTATSTDPINTAPTAPGSRDPSGVQSKSSEQLKSQQLQEEVTLLPLEQSPDPETPAVEERMQTDRGQTVSETSDELSLGPEPCAELEESFQLLKSDDRWEKMGGLHLIYKLAKQQPETLFPEMEDICQVVLREVLNPLDRSVSTVALWTLAGLLPLLKTYFDPFLDGVGDVLYLTAASDSVTQQRLADVALDHMIQSCSPLICMKVLLSKLSYPITEDPVQEAVARECIAEHLLALVESVRYEPEMHELLLSFSHLTQDTSEVVRSCAEKMLAVLSKHAEVPVVAASSETTASPSAPAPSELMFPSEDVNKKKLRDTLNAILPPRVWSEGNKQWMQPVSSKPATRADVIKLQQQLNLGLQQRQARETGICPIRRELYSQCFDELIRQTTIRCAERGLLLLRVRDESLMSMAAYQTLYENSVASGAREVQRSELSKAEMERKVPVVAASSETTASPSGPEVNKNKLQDTLNAILPPRVWSEGNKQWMQPVSSKPATRADVIKLQQQLDLGLQQRQARETGICPIRRELYSQCFDELIRQTTIGCVERGLLLARIRDESLMSMAAYQTLYENSVASGAREVQLSELSKAEMERKESTEFRENSVATPDTTDLRLLTTTQEKMTATSTDPINTAPTAPGSRDPSGVQSKSSEQLKSQQLQEEVTLLPLEQSPDPETPAVEERMQTDRGQTVSETSDELSLGPEPCAELEESFKLLKSDDRWEKMDGLHLIYKLAEQQPETLYPEMEDICQVVLREVLNPLDPSVSTVALWTLAGLLPLLKTYFDPFLDGVGDVLYLTAASDSVTQQRLADVALDHMIQSCSPLICMKVLLSKLSHPITEDPVQEAVARECIAEHLLALVESARYEPEMHELLLSFSHLTQDTSEVVRSCAEKMLAVLSKHEEVPVVAASSETTASPSGPAPSEPKFPSEDVNKKKLQDTLNAILPPRVWSEGNKQWMQPVSSKPATRADVIKLQQQLDLQLQQRQARETGICPIRRELYSQCFDELIRQTTIRCAERGLLLLRVRDESLMSMAAYQTLYEDSVASGAREVQRSELSKAEMERKVPVVAASSETTASPSGPVVNKKKLQDTLNAILPPRVWSEGNKQWMQPVSSKPATRADVIKLQQQLDLGLQQRQARETGICPIRRELYSQCFDELIRQTTIGCVERGLLLARVRDESLMSMAAYQTFNENSVASGAREVQRSELNKAEMERKESTEFRENSVATPDTTDLRLLTTTQEKMTATSTDPINTAPTAPGSRDPSGVQSKSSEQLKSQQLQEEVTLLPPEQSPDPETPAVEERMQTDRGQTVSETSDELSLGPEPCAELEESFKLLKSDDRWEKMGGLHLIYKLAEQQPETLFPEMEDICQVVLREVLNPLDPSMSTVALWTLAGLLPLLKTYFDPFLDGVGNVLYLTAASDSVTQQRLADVALDHMIQSCSPLICMKVLLSKLSHPITEDPVQEAVARECIAEHLLALVESARYEPEMHELLLSFSHLTQDTSEVVRSCAEKMLAVLSKHAEVPVVAASSETTASPSAPAPSEPMFPSEDVNKKKLRDTLNAILPPRVWSEGNKQWMQPVSSKPATRADVIKLQQQLDLGLQQRQARETGICPIRRELYSQCFDELIRQTTIGCVERGLLLLRVRDESLMSMAAYQTLYENSVASGAREVQRSELSKAEMERKVPVVAASSETTASPSGPVVNKKKLQDTLNAILPPRVWSEGNKQWMQPVSSIPATRADVIKLQQQLDLQLQQRQARETGICPIRRELYSQCFDELIRQTTIGCVERGFLLLRVRDESLMCMAAYQTLYENSVASGAREVQLSELSKAEVERKELH